MDKQLKPFLTGFALTFVGLGFLIAYFHEINSTALVIMFGQSFVTGALCAFVDGYLNGEEK